TYAGSGGSPFLGSGSGQPSVDHDAIAAYTITQDGTYAIARSDINRTNGSTGGSIALRVSVDNNAPPSSRTGIVGARSFNVSLGSLRAGQTIYVSVGSDGAMDSDSFHLDFQVNRTYPTTGLVTNTSFYNAAVTNISFQGSGGNDTFTNNTS